MSTQHRHLPWLVRILHVVGIIGLALTITSGFVTLNQLLLTTYLGTLLVIELESRWFALTVLLLSVLYLLLVGGQHTLHPPYELLATDIFYLLVALVIARIREDRSSQRSGRA